MTPAVSAPAPGGAFAPSQQQTAAAPTSAPGGDPRAASTGPPGADTGPPANEFASVLENQVARTAVAEGPKGKGQTTPTDQRSARDRDSRDGDSATPGLSTDAAVASTQAAVRTAVPAQPSLPASASLQAQAHAAISQRGALPGRELAAQQPGTAPLASSGTGGQTDGAVGTADGRTPAPTATLPGPTATSTSPAAATSTPASLTSLLSASDPKTGTATAGTTAATPAQPQAPGQAAPDAQGATPKAAAPPLPPAGAPGHAGTGSGAHPGQTSPGASPTASASASASPATTGSEQPTAPATHPAPPAQAAAPASQPTATATPTQSPSQPPFATQSLSPMSAPTASGAAEARPAVTLQHAIETVRMTIELAARHGYSQARIELSPPELGSLRIHLHQTNEGLVAKVVTEHAAAAQTLQQGAGDLRRSLESSGLSLLRLDIEASDQQGPQARDAQDFRERGSSPRFADDAEDTVSAVDGGGSEALTVQLTNGAIVNVLA